MGLGGIRARARARLGGVLSWTRVREGLRVHICACEQVARTTCKVRTLGEWRVHSGTSTGRTRSTRCTRL